MKKLLVLACSTSVLALASGAFAQTTSYNVQLSGTVAPYCNITTAALAQPISLPTTIGGLGSFSGSQAVAVQGNSKCAYTLGSASGGLKGNSTSVIVPYTASLSNSIEGPKVVGSDFNGPNPNFNSIAAAAVGAGQTVTINWSGAGESGLAADTYTDTLTLTVNAS